MEQYPRYTKITVNLKPEEWKALQSRALEEYRHPRDQARYLLRSALLDNPVHQKANRQDAKVSEAGSVKAVGA